jgi:hypothetical protein
MIKLDGEHAYPQLSIAQSISRSAGGSVGIGMSNDDFAREGTHGN